MSKVAFRTRTGKRVSFDAHGRIRKVRRRKRKVKFTFTKVEGPPMTRTRMGKTPLNELVAARDAARLANRYGLPYNKKAMRRVTREISRRQRGTGYYGR